MCETSVIGKIVLALQQGQTSVVTLESFKSWVRHQGFYPTLNQGAGFIDELESLLCGDIRRSLRSLLLPEPSEVVLRSVSIVSSASTSAEPAADISRGAATKFTRRERRRRTPKRDKDCIDARLSDGHVVDNPKRRKDDDTAVPLALSEDDQSNAGTAVTKDTEPMNTEPMDTMNINDDSDVMQSAFMAREGELQARIDQLEKDLSASNTERLASCGALAGLSKAHSALKAQQAEKQTRVMMDKYGESDGESVAKIKGKVNARSTFIVPRDGTSGVFSYQGQTENGGMLALCVYGRARVDGIVQMSYVSRFRPWKRSLKRTKLRILRR